MKLQKILLRVSRRQILSKKGAFLTVYNTTFSMVARCPKTLSLGVCVSTAVPTVGNRVPHVETGVGAIATLFSAILNRLFHR